MAQAEKPWKARRTDNPKREFGITQTELMQLPWKEVKALEVDFGEGWVRPARFMEAPDDPTFLPVAEDDE